MEKCLNFPSEFLFLTWNSIPKLLIKHDDRIDIFRHARPQKIYFPHTFSHKVTRGYASPKHYRTIRYAHGGEPDFSLDSLMALHIHFPRVTSWHLNSDFSKILGSVPFSLDLHQLEALSTLPYGQLGFFLLVGFQNQDIHIWGH